MRIKFDVRELRRLAQGLGWGLLAGIVVAGLYIGLSWLLVKWLGWGGILSLLLFVALVLASDFVKFERKDQMQEDQGQEIQDQEQEDDLRSDKYYDMAYELTRQGKSRTQAWQWYCEKLKISTDDVDKRHSFNVAMGRRKKGEVKGTEKRHAITQ